MRNALLAALAIVVLGAGGMLVIALAVPAPVALVEAIPRRVSADAARAGSPADEPAASPMPLARAREPSVKPAPAPEPERVWRAEPPRTSGPWDTIAAVNTYESLGKIARGTRTALDAYGVNRLESCFGSSDLEPQDEDEGVAPQDDAPVLLLRLEELDGAVRVAGAVVERAGSGSKALVACALDELRGATLTVPEATSGARHVLRYRLEPPASAGTLRPLR